MLIQHIGSIVICMSPVDRAERIVLPAPRYEIVDRTTAVTNGEARLKSDSGEVF